MNDEVKNMKYEELYKSFRIYSGEISSNDKEKNPITKYFTSKKMISRLFPSIEAARKYIDGNNNLPDFVSEDFKSRAENDFKLISELPMSLDKVKTLPVNYPIHIISTNNSYFAFVTWNDEEAITLVTSKSALVTRQYSDYGIKWWAFKINV